MNTIHLSLVAAILLLASPTTGHGQEKARKNLLSALKEGQTVAVKENMGRYEITLMNDVPLGHTIIEIGSDYIVVENAAKVTQTIIPIYSVKAIIKIKVPKE